MDAAQILALMTQATNLAVAIAAIASEAKIALSETDEATLKEKLAELGAANDAALARVQEKLAAAASQA